MKLTDKILKMKQDMTEFDKEVLTKLREIDEIIPVVDDEYLCCGHIIDIDVEDNRIVLEVNYGGYNNGYVRTQLCYFDMTKEELMEEKLRLEKAQEEENRQRIVQVYNEKLSEIENMKDQLNVLKAEIVATQEEAEELKRLSEKE